MWRDHFRSSWRGAVNNKLATFINIGGLALGLAVFFALTFYVQREFSWDAHWQDSDRMYVLARREEGLSGNSLPIPASVPYPVGTNLLARHAGSVETLARTYLGFGTVVSNGEEYANRRLYYAEPALLDLLQFELVDGSLTDVFADPRSVALSVTAAETLFGEESPLGRTISFNSLGGTRADYTIRAIYDIPLPTTFDAMQMLALLDPAALPVQNVDLDLWPSIYPQQRAPLIVSTYLKLKPGVDVGLLETDFRAFMDQNGYMNAVNSKTRFLFMPLQDLHLAPSLFNNGNSPERLWTYAAIGMLVLLISGCNFVMLATLRSIDRMREIGIRKTIGGESRQLMRQYLVDVLCQTFVAAMLAITLLELAQPWLNARLELALTQELLSWHKLALCFGIVAGFTLASGIYPALLMTQRKPAVLLRNGGGAITSGNTLRKLLVGLQFGVVIMLLLASGVLWQQIEYTRARDRGYDLEQVIGIRLFNPPLIPRTSTVATEFNRIPGIAGAAVGDLSPGAITLSQPSRFSFTATDGSLIEAGVQAATVGAGYFGVLSVPVLAGREFVADQDETSVVDASLAELDVVLNSSAATLLGFASPKVAVGSLITGEARTPDGQLHMQNMRVLGVVADTQFSSVLLPPVPQWYRLQPEASFVAVRFEPHADRAAVMAEMENAWTDIMGGAPFLTLSPEALEGPQLGREEFEARVVVGSAMLAMVIALLGLYGLVAVTVIKRVKEIGVRKTMGAGTSTIVALLIWQFSKPIVFASLVAWPLGVWSIMQWLQRFPYQLDTGSIVWSALSASATALLIAWLTVGLLAAKAASAKPVLALRYE